MSLGALSVGGGLGPCGEVGLGAGSLGKKNKISLDFLIGFLGKYFHLP